MNAIEEIVQKWTAEASKVEATLARRYNSYHAGVLSATKVCIHNIQDYLDAHPPIGDAV